MSGIAAGPAGIGPLAAMVNGFAAIAHAPATLATLNLTFGTSGQVFLTATPDDLSTDVPTRWAEDIQSSVGNGWHIRCTVNSGTVTGSATSTWLSLATNQAWGRTRSTPGINTANVTIDFSNDAGATIAASITGTIEARIT